MTPTHLSMSHEGIVDRLREEALALQQTAWSRIDGGQQCSLNANLAEEAADEIERLRSDLSTGRRTALLEAAGMKEALAQLNLIGHLTENMTERNWDDKRLYIMQSAHRLREALRELAEEA